MRIGQFYDLSGRVFASVGGGGIQVMVFITISEIFTIDKRGMVQGLVGAAFGIASIVNWSIGWRNIHTSCVMEMCFYINLPIGGEAIASTLTCHGTGRFMRDTGTGRKCDSM